MYWRVNLGRLTTQPGLGTSQPAEVVPSGASSCCTCSSRAALQEVTEVEPAREEPTSEDPKGLGPGSSFMRRVRPHHVLGFYPSHLEIASARPGRRHGHRVGFAFSRDACAPGASFLANSWK